MSPHSDYRVDTLEDEIGAGLVRHSTHLIAAAEVGRHHPRIYRRAYGIAYCSRPKARIRLSGSIGFSTQAASAKRCSMASSL